ncbi:MAG: hypothetical protein DRG78_08810 [Epsilonproteobacteria bacterium]|nr:MAG: hypothetical protein DRG78_08810 [Campylobacterota bacterium]
MKTFFITIALLLTANLNSSELDWVNEQVEAIKPPRIGMKNRELSTLKDPFIFLRKNRTNKPKGKNVAKKSRSTSSSNRATAASGKKTTLKKKSSLSVSLLMNSSAMINEKWYRVGDKINGYKISKIDSTSVLLIKNKKKLLLSTSSESKNLNFNNK